MNRTDEDAVYRSLSKKIDNLTVRRTLERDLPQHFEKALYP